MAKSPRSLRAAKAEPVVHGTTAPFGLELVLGLEDARVVFARYTGIIC